jgi:hypothetical protein
MPTHPALSIGVLVSTLVLLPRAARAELRRSMLFADMAVGTHDATLTVADRTTDEHWNAGVALEAGYTRTLRAPWFGLTFLGRYGVWADGWSSFAGERRTRFDLWVAPEFRHRFGTYGLAPTLSIAAGFGPTLARIAAAPHRSVRESYGTGFGLNTGARTTLTARPFGAHGILLLAQYSLHVTLIRHRIAASTEPGLTSSELYRFVDRQLLLGAGYLVEF